MQTFAVKFLFQKEGSLKTGPSEYFKVAFQFCYNDHQYFGWLF